MSKGRACARNLNVTSRSPDFIKQTSKAKKGYRKALLGQVMTKIKLVKELKAKAAKAKESAQ